MKILEVQNLSKIYGKEENQINALKNVSFGMEKGEFAAVVGESGSGKSTLLNCIGGLDTPTAGRVFVDGEDLFQLDERKRTIFRRRNIGFIFQAFHLIPELNVEQNMVFPLLLDGQRPEQSRVDELLTLTGLSDTGKKKVRNFSLGMKQRLGIAIALLRNPDFLILDEPVNGLDPSGILEIRQLLVRLNREKQVTILISSHILGELSKIATHYGIIRNGRLIREFDTGELKLNCRRCLKIITPDAPGAAKVLEETLNIHSYDVPETGLLRIFERLEETVEINRTLVENGIPLKESRLTGQDLESYFMELTGN